MPTVLGGLIELIIIGIIIVVGCYFFIKCKRKYWIADTWVSRTVGSKDDIESIAKKYKISWKLLAKIKVEKARVRAMRIARAKKISKAAGKVALALAKDIHELGGRIERKKSKVKRKIKKRRKKLKKTKRPRTIKIHCQI